MGMRFQSPTWRSWYNMLYRCGEPTSRAQERYRRKHPVYGRVTVCERWKSFENFLEDMGERPEGCTLDRIDNTGNYEPGNCRWATAKAQNRNRSSNVFVEYQGRRMCVSDWAEELQINHSTLVYRLRRGWPVERALTAPVREKRQHVREKPWGAGTTS